MEVITATVMITVMGTKAGTATGMGMATEPATGSGDMLLLSQWLSPAFPVGAFAWSHGLEAAVQDGVVTPDTLAAWLEDVLCRGAGRADAALIGAAAEARDAAALAQVDALACALAPSAGRLAETLEQGRAFALTVSAVWPENEIPRLCYPVALGRAAALHGLSAELTATLYLQAFIANLTSAATRLVPLGQTGAQALVARLSGRCAPLARAALAEGLDGIASMSLAADIASMRHEQLYSRIFRS